MREVRVRAELSGAERSAGGPAQNERSLAGLVRGDTEGSGPDSAGDRLLLLSPRSFIPPARGAGAKLQVQRQTASALAFQPKSTRERLKKKKKSYLGFSFLRKLF